MVTEVFAKQSGSGMKNVLLPLCKKRKAYLFELDKREHFWLRINHVHQLFRAQEFFLDFYRAENSQVMTRPRDMVQEQIEGNVCIHPSAEIHPGAKIGPNVTIGAQVKVGDGARIKNSIILEDVVVHPHAFILNAIIGWTSVIGSWVRIEGVESDEKSAPTQVLQATTQQGFVSNFAENAMMAEAYLNDETEYFQNRISEKPSCHET